MYRPVFNIQTNGRIDMPESVLPPEVTIRRATISDVAELSEFIKPFVAQGRLLQRTTMELEILVANCFLAVYQGRVVGCAALEIYSDKLAELRSLAVDPNVRRMGIGHRLVEACVESAKQHNILEVMAITSSEAALIIANAGVDDDIATPLSQFPSLHEECPRKGVLCAPAHNACVCVL